jgi:hypothetical protein
MASRSEGRRKPSFSTGRPSRKEGDGVRKFEFANRKEGDGVRKFEFANRKEGDGVRKFEFANAKLQHRWALQGRSPMGPRILEPLGNQKQPPLRFEEIKSR